METLHINHEAINTDGPITIIGTIKNLDLAAFNRMCTTLPIKQTKMTKQEALNKIEEATKNIEELKKFIEQEGKEGFSDGDTYYYVDDNGYVDPAEWEDDEIDNFRLGSGNAHKTKALAEEALVKQLAINKINKWIRDNGAEAENDSTVWIIKKDFRSDWYHNNAFMEVLPRLLMIDSEESADRCVQANRAEYELLFKGL